MADTPLANFSSARNDAVCGTSEGEVTRDATGISSSKTCQRRMSFILSTISHVLICVFTLYIFYLSFANLTLFSWHPLLMTFGTLLLMGEAVMAMSPDNLFSGRFGRQERIRMHWILQALAALFTFSGFLIIVIKKNQSNNPHFQTWHAIFGLLTVIFVGITSSGGVIALYSVRLKHIIRPASIKLAHNVIGIITFIIGVICLILSVYSNWFSKKHTETSQVFFVLLIICSALFAVESAIKSAYHRMLPLFLGN